MKFLETRHGKLAYEHFPAEGKTKGKSVIFLNGFGSHMMGSKASYLQNFCQANNIAFTRFDYLGHGASSGDIIRGSIGIWLNNAEDILTEVNKITNCTQILVGSSMGGWLTLLLAKKHPDMVKALIGIASAPDFTEDLYNNLTEEQKKTLHKMKFIIKNEGEYQYAITENLIEDAKRYLLLESIINFNKEVILLHGLQDAIVPYSKSIAIAQKLSTANVIINLVKHADHHMKDKVSLRIISEAILSLL